MSTTDPSTHGRKPSASLRNELRNSGFPLSSRCNDDAVDSIAMITFAYDTSGGKDSDKKCATSSLRHLVQVASVSYYLTATPHFLTGESAGSYHYLSTS
jgi:hypothetical protein